MKLTRTMMVFMAGVITGMMYAPKEGKKLREDVKNTTKKAIRKVEKIKKEEIDMVKDTAETVKNKAKDIAKTIEEQ